ncbi:MAG: Nudix family hydrolase [Burkholderiaceae bacterium]
MSEKIVDVAAGVILRPDGKLLLGQRPVGKPWSGWWELPGGKLEPGETVAQALARELKEEIGIDVQHSRPWVTYVHAYPEKTVRLAFHQVTRWAGEPQGLESQALQWVTVGDAHRVGDLLPATLPVLRWLSLPEQYGISSIGSPEGVQAFLSRLDVAMGKGLRLVQLREPAWPLGAAHDSLRAVMLIIRDRCHAAGARLLINSVHPRAWADDADGVHLRAADAMSAQADAMPAQADALGTRRSGLLGVSAHTPQEVARARALDADFVVAGPVLPSASHPGDPGIGWSGFERMLCDAGLPAFAIGGQSEHTLAQARQAGAHGIAGIRAFL